MKIIRIKMQLNKVTIFLLFLIYSQGLAFLLNKYNKMIEKAKTYYKSKFGKNSTWHFLGHDLSEYPGTHKEYRKINKEKWDEYYKCLETQKNSLGFHGSIIPEAVLGYESSSIKLDCKICVSPKELNQKDSVEWYWAPKYKKKLEPIEYTEHILLASEEKTLKMYNLQRSQTGLYVCFLGKTAAAPYFVTVVNSSLNIEQVHSESAKSGPYPKQPEYVSEYKMYLATEWNSWSPCSKCDQVGKRYRIGYCTMFSETYFDPSAFKSILKNKDTLEENDETQHTVVKELDLLNIFRNGIPCQSHILPKHIMYLPVVKNRKNEIIIGYCKVQCEDNKVFEVKDKNGNTIETANNSAGVYSILQGIPPAEPDIERRLIYAAKGEDLVLSCPGNLNTDAPINWQIGNKNIVPEIIFGQSKGRISVSILDKLIIQNVHLTDSNIYSCWQNRELAGSIRLVVEKKIKLNFNHHVILLGIVIILSTFLYVFVKAFFGRTYAQDSYNYQKI